MNDAPRVSTNSTAFRRGVASSANGLDPFMRADAGVIALDASGNITALNGKACGMLDCTEDDTIGANWVLEYIPPPAREKANAIFRRILSGAETRFEPHILPVLCGSRGERMVSWHILALKDDRGRIVGTLIIGSDVIERLGPRELDPSRPGRIDNVDDAVIVRDSNLVITAWNEGAEKMFGWKSSEALGKGPKEMSNLGYHGIEQEEILEGLKSQGQIKVETVQEKKDGTRLDVEVTAATLHDEIGEITGFVSVTKDISERKRAEENLKSARNYLENLFDYANAPIIVWDPSFKITRFNHAFERLTGYWSEEVMGKELSILFPVGANGSSFERINETISGRYWESVEMPILRKDGTVRVALWNSANIYADDGKTLVATIAQGQDITERKEAEERTQALNESLAKQAVELEAVNRELEAFNYSVSHDLRAPLRALDGFSAALLDGYSDNLDDQGKEYLDHVRQASQRMGQLIDDLLKLSRITRDKMNWERVDLSSLAREIIRDLRTAQPDRKVDVTIADGAFMTGDPRLLKIALENLLGNAWKFTSRSKDARIEFGTASLDGQRVFYVRDNGVGFDMTYASKLFNPFQRLHTAKQFPGTGIGLAKAMRIIARHGGRIWAESQVGHGATFFFTGT